jgi:lipid II:glycine glycyltransferase (peptidoglycan interpeptide bridge formation enzyme)
VFADLSRSRFPQVRLRLGWRNAPAWSAAAPASAVRVPHVTHVIDLRDGFGRVWDQAFSKSTRRNTNKAESEGLTIETGSSAELVDVFYDLYMHWTEERARKRGIPLRLARLLAGHREPRRKYDEVARRLGEGCCIWVASDRGLPVAAAIALTRGRSAVHWRSASYRPTRASKYANVLLTSRMIESACAAGCHTMDLGESGGVRSLVEYKERFGARPVQTAEYRLERLPLTRLERSARSVTDAVARCFNR